jgi:hypothetical protein
MHPPDPAREMFFEYESNGTLDQNRLNINIRSAFRPGFNFFANYTLGFARGDSDGAGTFPAYSYDLDNEFGRSSFDIRHNFVIGGNFTFPWGISVSPFIIASSDVRSISQGSRRNGDARLRSVRRSANLPRLAPMGFTRSYCDVAGEDPNAIIPRNFGEAPGYFSVNLRLGKTFGFGKSA